MKNYKNFSKIFFLILVGFLIFHLVIWNIYTKYVFPEDYSVGDLGRMSYKLDSLTLRKNENTFKQKHIDSTKWDKKKVDILTIGDSFSNGGGAGKNNYYQDYLVNEYGLKILNIQNIKPAKNYLETLYMLNNSKVLDIMKPKIIIFESTEPQVLNRFSINNINNKINMKKENLLKSIIKETYKSKQPDVSFINNLNYNALLYNILYKFDDNAYFSNAYISILNKSLFSSKDDKSLLFYKATIKYNKSINEDRIKRLNSNLNNLAIILKNKQIKLYFMPAVDKYNLYSKYIVNNKYKDNTFFEQLRRLKKDYILIDTKKILKKEIDKGVKDIFYSDDTHWSYKASEAISNSLKEFTEYGNK